jgi:aspartate/methionine/tyrosine aminotransferase
MGDAVVMGRDFIASRMAKIDSSGIRKVFDLAQKMENPLSLSIGQPDFDVPDAIKEEAIEQIRAGFNKYTVTQGIPELRDGVRKHLAEHRMVQAEEVMITSGVSGGLVLASLVLINPGDEVLIPDPYFVMYKHLVNLSGGIPVFYNTYPDFRLRKEELASKVTSKTKILILNSPSNPTGRVLDEGQLKMAADFAQVHDLLILSDEIYEDFVYDSPYVSIGSLYPKTLTVSGFSKSHAMTGWRVGYAAGPGSIIREMIKLQQFSFVCAPSFAQKAALLGLSQRPEKAIVQYKAKRDRIYEKLKEFLNVEKPDGAFYIFPEAPGGRATAFVAKAIDKGLLIIPGNVFSERDTHMRISYAAADETIDKGIEILREIA